MRAEFSPDLMKDASVSVMTDFDGSSEVLLISFAGVGIGMGVPYFEFLKLISDLPVQKMFVRDVQKSWYHAGLKGLSANIDQSVEVLRGIIAESGARRVLTIGNSMGGYAAILYGALLGADEVLVFAPTTFANWKNRLRYLDFRPLFGYLRRSPVKSPKYYDLARVPGIEKPRIQIYFDADYREDTAHARHLAKAASNVQLHPCYIGGKHHVIKKLKEQGELQGIIQSSIENLY